MKTPAGPTICDCGTASLVPGRKLVHGSAAFCGCWRADRDVRQTARMRRTARGTWRSLPGAMAMDPTTITTTTFTLMQGVLPVVGTVTYVGTTATFQPANPLPANSLFTATITTGAADPLGATLANNYV
jgi:hypothetical protein